MLQRIISTMVVVFLFLFPFSNISGAEENNQRPFYQMEITYHPQKDQVQGKMNVTIPVTSADGLKELYFHLYPNVFQEWKYGEEAKPSKPGKIEVSQVKVDGKSVQKSVKDTIMKVPLPSAKSKGELVRAEMDFTLDLPRGGTRLNTFQKTAFLAQWYPMLAVKDKEGWHIDPYTTTGDPFYTQMSDFEVVFHVPKGYQVITTAKDEPSASDQPIRLKQTKVRDFAAVITQDYQVKRGEADHVRVNLWYVKGMEPVVDELHQAAKSGMTFFNEKFGRYPYEEIDIVLGETGYGIAGMEYPGLITSIPMIQTDQGERAAVNVVVHELAHQWWYGVVGNNQVKEPWLDEGLTTFSEFYYMHKQMNEDERDLLKKAAKRTDEIYQEVGVTSAEPLYKYPDSVYGLMVYIRPAAMMYDLIEKIGEEKVVEILRSYYDTYKFKIATTQDFIEIANKVADQDLSSFFAKWLHFK